MSKPLTTLTQRHWNFIEAYDGNEVEAMRIAGFEGENGYLKSKALDLLADPLIQDAIRERSRFKAKQIKIIADREERQALWTAIMRNNDPHYKEEVDSNGIPVKQGNIPIDKRLKAAELLGKSEGDFIDRIDVNANVTLTDLVQESYKVHKSTDEIEAEWTAMKEADESEVKEITNTPAIDMSRFL